MNGLAKALSRQHVQRTITCAAMGIVHNKVDIDLITTMGRMTIELSVMDCIRTTQQVDGLPNWWIAKKVHP